MYSLYVYDDDLSINYVRVTNTADAIPSGFTEKSISDRKTVYEKSGEYDIVLFHRVDNLESLVEFLKARLDQSVLRDEYYRQRRVVLYNKNYLVPFLFIKQWLETIKAWFWRWL